MAEAATDSTTVVPMPRLSDSMEEGVIVAWLVAAAEEVAAGQEIVEIETDKATMLFEAPESGPIYPLAEVGATVAVGDPIAQIGAAPDQTAGGGSTKPEPAPAEAVGHADAASGSGSAAAADSELRVSPVARRLAESRGVDLATVTGTGPAGRIVKADVLAAAEGAATGAPAPAAVGARGGSRRQEPTRAQAMVARRMSESRATVPDFPLTTEVEMSAALALRAQLGEGADPVPSLNDLVVAAVARTLPRHPRLNASYADGGFEFFEQVNVGIAVAAAGELLVPTVAGADRLSLLQIAAESRRLIERVRSGEITPPDLAGGTFTVSNLGMFGVSSFQPIINPPQAAILGVGAVREARGSSTMTLTLVSDHRIVYGADAAVFAADLRELLEHPARLLLGA